ncbi:MAG: carbohydrate binding domain-containing protein, partial [Solirubrobacterales bacterium]|nr:carbohydrate binding domain-containing protein [Solirubrobacterales bacterium]
MLGTMLAIVVLSTTTFGAARAAAAPIYWGAHIGSNTAGDPYMPSGCNDVPPWSEFTYENDSTHTTCTPTTSGKDSDPWTVFTGPSVANHSLSILPLGQVWYQKTTWNPSGWQDFTTLGLDKLFDIVRSNGAIPMFTFQSSPPSDAPNAAEWTDANIAGLPSGSSGSSSQNPGDHQYCDSSGACRTFDDYLNSFAREAAAYGHPFFMRLDQEANGSWFPWGENSSLGNTGSDFIAMWKHVHDIFDCVADTTYTPPSGCTPALNVTWVWSPNIEGSPSDPSGVPSVSSVFPAGVDAAQRPYVDWTSLDVYNHVLGQGNANWPLSNLLKGGGPTNVGDSYDDVVNLAPSAPMMLGEFGSEETPSGGTGGTKADWLTAALTQTIPALPQIRAVNYYNIQDHYKGGALDGDLQDYPIESSAAATSAFASGINSGYYQGADTSDSFSGAVNDGQPIQAIGGFTGPNLLSNASFESGTSGWWLSNSGGANATLSSDSSTSSSGSASAKVAVTTATPGTPWNVQFGSSPVQLFSDRAYTVTFWAKASAARTITAAVQQSASPWTNYGSKSFSITTAWKKYSYTVPAQNIQDAATYLNFQLAQSAGTVWLDDASL